MTDRALREALRRWEASPDDPALVARAVEAHVRAGQPAPTRLLLAHVSPGREVTSVTALEVWAELAGGAVSHVGRTGARAAVRLPAHRAWWVSNLVHGGRGIASPRLVDEVAARDIPGVVLRDLDQDAATLERLAEAAPDLTLVGLERATGDVGPGALALAARFPALRRLRARGVRWRDAVAAPLDLRELVDVRLEATSHGQGVTPRAVALLPPSVGALAIPQARLGREGWARVTALPELSRLDASASDITGEDLAALAERACGLEELTLAGCAFLDGLAPLAVAPRLRRLDLGRTFVGPWLEALRGAPALEALSLARCPGLDDDALREVAKLTSLREVDLDHCLGFTTRGLVALAKLPRLERLSARGDPSTAKGRAAGAAAVRAALPGCAVLV